MLTDTRNYFNEFDSVKFKQITESLAHDEGRVFYDQDNHALAYYNDAEEVTIQIGQETILRVKNVSGALIHNGRAVYISGVSDEVPTIALACACGILGGSEYLAVGLATHDIDNNEFGYVTVRGIVRDIDTSHLIEGKPAYLSSLHNGTLTSDRPVSPHHSVTLGITIISDSTAGQVLVGIAMSHSLSDLIDIEITNPQEGQRIAYDSTGDFWFNTFSLYEPNLKEPTGFLDRITSNISFDDLTQTLTITGTYKYYIWGQIYDITGIRTQTIVGPGTNYFYLDKNKILQVHPHFHPELLMRDNAYVATIYWDPIDSKHIYFGDERHTIWWDWNLHYQQHNTVGTRYDTGLEVLDATACGIIQQIWNGDDTLWTFSVISSIPADFVISAAQNHTPGGTNSLNFTDSEDDDIAQFYKGSLINLSDYNSLQGWIYITSWGAGDDIQFYGYNTTTDSVVGTPVNLSDYVVETTLNSWQMFDIPLTDMGLQFSTVDAFRMQMIGAGDPPSGYIDDIKLNNITCSDDDLKVGVGDGIIWDEDIRIVIPEVSKGSYDFAVLYREGASGDWTHDGTTDVLFKYVPGGRVTYNQYTGGVWQQTQVPSGSFTYVHIFATNDFEYPVVGVQAQSIFTNVSTIRETILTDINNILAGNLPFEECIPIASLALFCHDEVSNSYKANFIYLDNDRTQIWQDFRQFRGASTGSLGTTDHGSLSGLADDDHPQYLTEGRGDERYALYFGKNSNYASSDETSSTSLTTYQDKVSITTPAISGVVRVGYSMEYNGDTPGDIQVRLYNSTDANEVAENSQETNNANNWFSFSGFYYITLTGGSRIFTLQYKAGTSNCLVRNARLEVWRQS